MPDNAGSSQPAASRDGRKKRDRGPMLVGEVLDVERLTPSMVRVRLGGPGLDNFVSSDSTDQYVTAQFLPAGSALSVPFDKTQTDELEPADRPRSRRYTVRHWDDHARVLSLDFVTHGDTGYAGRWAQNAEPGDRLQFSNPRGSYAPDPNAAWHLLAGDESALPAIAASLDAMPAQARGVVFAVVESAAHELTLPEHDGFVVTWLHRSTAEQPDQLLLQAVAALEFDGSPVDVFVHGEAGEVRDVRKHLIANHGFVWDDMSISPYWRRGKDDEAWREIKRSWVQDELAALT